ncbi:MAG TPA: group I intron-associated PD-(D/E)XK endonuclease [Ktedonobacteraceae bacterium]
MGLFPPRREKQTDSELGRQGETFVISRLMEVGYVVLVPVDGTQRYDMVIEDANGQFWRIQCKTGKWKEAEGVIIFSARKSSFSRGAWAKTAYTYHDAVDFFAVYSRELQKVYLVPIDQVGVNEGWLRVKPAPTQRKGFKGRSAKLAEDYEL